MTIAINQRFNDKCPGICYDISIDREHTVPDEEVRQRTDFGERRISCRAQAHTAALSERVNTQEMSMPGQPPRPCDTQNSSTMNRSERNAVANEEADRKVATLHI